MPTSTTNYELIKPGTDDPILIEQINDNMDTIDTVLKDHSDKIDAAALGIKYKGEVNYYADLPNNAEIGDAYTVKYAGSSGTTPDGTEYVWGTVSGTSQWINFSKDSYTKAEVDALLALKQNALTTAQLAAVNSGIDSTKVEQIETNKNNILTLETMNGSKNKFNLSAWSTCAVTRGTKSISGTDITISATGYNCYTAFANPDYPIAANIPVSDGDQIVITWQYITSDSATGQVHVFPNGSAEGAVYRDAHTYDNLPYIIPPGCTFVTIRFSVLENGKSATYSNVQVMSKTAYDAGFTDYQPYAMSNAELTAAIQALQAQLANQ